MLGAPNGSGTLERGPVQTLWHLNTVMAAAACLLSLQEMNSINESALPVNSSCKCVYWVVLAVHEWECQARDFPQVFPSTPLTSTFILSPHCPSHIAKLAPSVWKPMEVTDQAPRGTLKSSAPEIGIMLGRIRSITHPASSLKPVAKNAAYISCGQKTGPRTVRGSNQRLLLLVGASLTLLLLYAVHESRRFTLHS